MMRPDKPPESTAVGAGGRTRLSILEDGPSRRPASPQGLNVISRGCNPRWASSNGIPTLQGSNHGAVGKEFGPFRAGGLIVRPTVGCCPRLFTLKPAGFPETCDADALNHLCRSILRFGASARLVK
jgi:hypothetical protein